MQAASTESILVLACGIYFWRKRDKEQFMYKMEADP